MHVVAVETEGLLEDTVRPTVHQMRLGVNKKSDDGIESIYQNKIGNSLNSESKVKKGVC